MKQSASRWPRRFLLAIVLTGATAGAALVAFRMLGLMDAAAAARPSPLPSAWPGAPAGAALVASRMRGLMDPAAAAPAAGPTSKPAKQTKLEQAELFFSTVPPPRLRLRVGDKEMQALRANAR